MSVYIFGDISIVSDYFDRDEDLEENQTKMAK